MARLDVSVTERCSGCDEVRRLAEAIASRVTTVSVRVVHLEHEPDERPDVLVAVPTDSPDGRAISLGSPRQKDPVRQLERVLEARGSEEGRDGSP